MLLYGALLRCLDPVLTIAAAQAWGRPIFWSPPDRRDAVSVLAGDTLCLLAWVPCHCVGGQPALLGE
jgi:hypothetical protein